MIAKILIFLKLLYVLYKLDTASAQMELERGQGIWRTVKWDKILCNKLDSKRGWGAGVSLSG